MGWSLPLGDVGRHGAGGSTSISCRANRAQVWSARSLFGATLAEWGLFNLVEGTINHHLVELHHVRPGHPFEAFYDGAFLAFGFVMLLIGTGLVRSAQSSVAALTGSAAALKH